MELSKHVHKVCASGGIVCFSTFSTTVWPFLLMAAGNLICVDDKRQEAKKVVKEGRGHENGHKKHMSIDEHIHSQKSPAS